jgi:hypothetical protein
MISCRRSHGMEFCLTLVSEVLNLMRTYVSELLIRTCVSGGIFGASFSLPDL